MSKLDEYFKQKTKNISFIEIKPKTFIDVNGYRVTEDVPLPIVVDDLIEEVKTNEDANEIKFASFINGIIYTLGVDPEFKFFKEYRHILYSYDKKIEDYIIYKGLKDLSENNLEIGMIWLRAIYYINNKNLFGKYNYALAIAEKAKKAFEGNDRTIGEAFLNCSTKILEEILEDDPKHHLALYKLGYHYKSRNEFRKSKITWEKFLRVGKEDELLNEVRECLDIIEDNAVYEEGYNLILEGYSDEGLEILLPLVDAHNKWWNLYFMIGLGYRQVGEFDKAKEYFLKVLELEEDQVDALNELGLCSVYIGEVDEALRYFTKAIELRPTDYEIMCNRGMTYLQMNNIESAKKDILKAYEINPDDEITLSCMHELDQYII